MTRPTLIVPGLNGSTEGHWQHYWLRDDPRAVLVEQSDWSNPNAELWMANLERALRAHPGALVVGHSLGAILTARVASSGFAHLVGGALLVAPADIERTSALHARNYEFGKLPTAALPFPALVVTSRDDVYMSGQKAQSLARAWQAPQLDLGYVGHINIASGFGRWPQSYALAHDLFEPAKHKVG